MIPVYGPDVTVVVTKLIARSDGNAQPYSGSIKTVDLSDVLGDGGVIQTQKAIGAPAGAFSISWADQPTDDGVSYLDLLEPMDMVEIRASRVAYQYPGKMPLIMRGFITALSLSESIGDDGRPLRTANISGQDFGKLWQIHAIWLELLASTDQLTLDTFQFQAVTGIGTTALDVNDFMSDVALKIMNGKIADMAGVSNETVPKFKAACTVPTGIIIPAMIAQVTTGNWWEIIERLADRPWNELFVAEGEDGPTLTFRPVPYRDLGGNYIMQGATDPGTMAVDDSEIVSSNLVRSDASVANFFWVPPGSSALDNNFSVTVGTMVRGTLFDQSYANNDPKLFGEKRMDATSVLMPGSIKTLTPLLPVQQRAAQSQDYLNWHQQRAVLLGQMNRDNGVYEQGTLELVGRESYVPGQYLQVTRGQVVTQSYCTAVSHVIAPLQRWTTTLTLERGDGFLQRQQIGSQSSYALGRNGPYSPPTDGF